MVLRVSKFYSEDNSLRAIAKREGLSVLRIAGIVIPNHD